MPTVLLCGGPELEAELAGSPVMAGGIERHRAAKLEEAQTLALAARPELVLIDIGMPRAVALVEGLRAEASTRRLSIAVLARGDFDPGELAFLEAGANAILRLPADDSWAERVRRLMEISVRKAARLPISFAVGMHPRDSSAPIPATVLNLSATGMLLESTYELSVGDEASLEFTLPGEPASTSLVGRIVRRAGARQFGLEFVALEAEARDALSRFLAAPSA